MCPQARGVRDWMVSMWRKVLYELVVCKYPGLLQPIHSLLHFEIHIAFVSGSNNDALWALMNNMKKTYFPLRILRKIYVVLVCTHSVGRVNKT